MTIHVTGRKKSSNEKQTSNVKQEKIKDKRQLLVQTCEARPFIKKNMTKGLNLILQEI